MELCLVGGWKGMGLLWAGLGGGGLDLFVAGEVAVVGVLTWAWAWDFGARLASVVDLALAFGGSLAFAEKLARGREIVLAEELGACLKVACPAILLLCLLRRALLATWKRRRFVGL